MLKPQLVWSINAATKCVFIGTEYFGEVGFSKSEHKYYAARVGRYRKTEHFDGESEATAQLEKWAHEFFESVIEVAKNEP